MKQHDVKFSATASKSASSGHKPISIRWSTPRAEIVAWREVLKNVSLYPRMVDVLMDYQVRAMFPRVTIPPEVANDPDQVRDQMALRYGPGRHTDRGDHNSFRDLAAEPLHPRTALLSYDDSDRP